MDLLNAPFILFRDDFSGDEVLFDRPRKIIVAEQVEDFFPALEAAQKAHDAGKWLAGYFSYEAGYLLEPKLAPIIPKDRRTPLMVLGVFDGPSEDAPCRRTGGRRPTARSSASARPGRSRTTGNVSTACTGICARATATRRT